MIAEYCDLLNWNSKYVVLHSIAIDENFGFDTRKSRVYCVHIKDMLKFLSVSVEIVSANIYFNLTWELKKVDPSIVLNYKNFVVNMAQFLCFLMAVMKRKTKKQKLL